MKINMEFEGLRELVKAFEDAASDEDIKDTNLKIVQEAEPVVKRIMAGKIPKSSNISRFIVRRRNSYMQQEEKQIQRYRRLQKKHTRIISTER